MINMLITILDNTFFIFFQIIKTSNNILLDVFMYALTPFFRVFFLKNGGRSTATSTKFMRAERTNKFVLRDCMLMIIFDVKIYLSYNYIK